MELMEGQEAKPCFGYGKPPWRFRGSALYQLHLVKSEVARALIPKEFRLVEAFGYTLGGFFLAHYDDSPAGVFNELVVIAGTVWNPPTSCAWAAKVLVNSVEACVHGRKHVGLPSRVAKFSKRERWCPAQKLIIAPPFGWRQEDGDNHHHKLPDGFLNIIGIASTPQCHMSTQVSEISSAHAAAATDAFRINMLSPGESSHLSFLITECSAPTLSFESCINCSTPEECWCSPVAGAVSQGVSSKLQWPHRGYSLPSQVFLPNGVQVYLISCLLNKLSSTALRVRMVQPINISGPPTSATYCNQQHTQHYLSSNLASKEHRQPKQGSASRLIVSVMLSKPILALEFNCLKMIVEAPLIVSQ